jgi:hypothetical protein
MLAPLLLDVLAPSWRLSLRSGRPDSALYLLTAVNGWPGAENYSGDCCRWLCVGCSLFGAEELRVVSLDLNGRGLTGVVSSRLAGLDELRVLNLSRNSLAVPCRPSSCACNILGCSA